MTKNSDIDIKMIIIKKHNFNNIIINIQAIIII